MKVRYVEAQMEQAKDEDYSRWLTDGGTYVVLSVELEMHGSWMLRLMGDSANEVALFPLQSFEVVSDEIPRSWVVRSESSFLYLGPTPWFEASFWERFYDRDPDALRIFDEQLAALSFSVDD
jgi:hypothetical protein